MNDKVTSANGRQRAAKILRIIAMAIGSIASAFFLALIIGDLVASIGDGFSGPVHESLFIIVPVLIAIASFIVTWWRELTGGILLVAAYLLISFSPSLHSVWYGADSRFIAGMFYVALPFLVSGVLFIVAARLSGKSS